MEMISNHVFAILVCSFLCTQCVGSKSVPTTCRDASVPALVPRGDNRIEGKPTKPLFELKVTPQGHAGTPQAHEVRLVSHGQGKAFADATISISSQGGSCGTGSLQYESNDFLKVEQDTSCPQTLFTNPQTPMSSIPPLIWVPPSCGCVLFRVVLLQAGGKIHYAENDDVTSGPLAKRICSQDKPIELTREQRLAGLCHVAEKHSNRDILSHAAFRQRHQLDIHYTDRLELEVALELRRADARMCCSKPSQVEQLRCFDVSRFRRADQFCQDGFPDIPFVSFRAMFMRAKERRCCSILGAYRYMCFAKDSQLKPGNDVTPMDFSLDATDPANDMAELGTLDDYNDFLKQFRNTSNLREEEKRENKNKDASIKEVIKADASSIDKTFERKLKANDKPTNIITQEEFEKKIAQESLTPFESDPAFERKLTNDKDIDRSRSRSDLKRQDSDAHLFRRLPTEDKSGTFSNTRSSFEREKYGRQRSSRGRAGNRRTSGERKPKSTWAKEEKPLQRPVAKTSGLSREERRGGRRFTSAERKLLRGRSNHKDDHADVEESIGGTSRFMEDIDDQGGRSVKETLNYLTLKMERLELRRLCCQAGARFGQDVYGSLAVVTDECKHSSHKYLQRKEVAFGVRMCRHQFVKCCVNDAKMGLAMTSSEFRDQAYDAYDDNIQQAGPVTNGNDFLGRRGAARTDRRPFGDPKYGRKEMEQEVEDEDEILGELDADSDWRFDSMRAETGDPRFDSTDVEDDDEDDEEYTGPRRFDDIDNRDWIDDDVTEEDGDDQNNPEFKEPNSGGVKTEKDNRETVRNNEDKKEKHETIKRGKDNSVSKQTDVGKEGSDDRRTLIASGNSKPEKNSLKADKLLPETDKNGRRIDSSRQNIDTPRKQQLLRKTSSSSRERVGFERKRTASSGGRSRSDSFNRGGKSRASRGSKELRNRSRRRHRDRSGSSSLRRRNRSRYNSKPSRYDSKQSRYNSKQSRYDSKQSRYDSKQSRYDSKQSRRGLSSREDTSRKRQSNARKQKKQMAMDSKELAEAHHKRVAFKGGLDSEEMAAEYRGSLANHRKQRVGQGSRSRSGGSPRRNGGRRRYTSW